MAKRQTPLSGYFDAGAVLQFLHGHGGSGAEKNALLRSLVVEAQSDSSTAETATSLAILALWPGLDALRKRLRRYYRADPELLTTELLGGLSQVILSAKLERVSWIAATFLRNIERDLKRGLVRRAKDGRICHAMELDPAYVDVAVLRWEAFTGQVARLADTDFSFADVSGERRAA